MTAVTVSGGSARRPRGWVLGFVSIGFTLKVWRNWTRDQVFKLKSRLELRPRIQPKHQIWIFGSARSGTTWLMEVLQRGFRLHSVFEFALLNNPAFPKDLSAHRPLIAKNLSELGLSAELIQGALTGRFTNRWIDRTNPLIQWRKVNGVVLKDVAHRLLQISAFTSVSVGVVPVILLRQPIDTVRSLASAHRVWGTENAFQTKRLGELLEVNRDRLTSAGISILEHACNRLQADTTTPLSSLAIWCFHNLVALETMASNPKLRVVLYDRMVAPETEARVYLEGLFGKFDFDPQLARRSDTDFGKAPLEIPGLEAETATVLAEFGLGPLTLPGQPHLLDLDALVAEYRKPASDRLTPRFTR